MKTAKTVLLVVCACVALQAKPKMPKELRELPNGQTRDVIVVFKKDRREAGRGKVKGKGSKKTRHDYANVGAMALELDGKSLRELADDDDDIDVIAPDRPVKANLEFANPTVGAQTARSYGWTGAGVGVAVLDSGVNPHADFGNRIVYSQSFVPGDASTGDKFGHGTHVAGIIAGDGSSSATGKYTFRGVAPQANIINLRVLDGIGRGYDSDIIAAIDRAIALRNTYNIRVLNLSFGRPVRVSHMEDPLCWAVERAWWDYGIVVVASAGNAGRYNAASNEGYGTIMAPGNDPFIITVGAARDMATTNRADDTMTSFSSKGPTAIDHVVKPDLVAPGNSIISTRASGSLLDLLLNRVAMSYYITGGAATVGPYMRLSGTSMATPMVSGAAALMLQKTPTLSPDVVKARLMRTATKTFPAQTSITDAGTTYVARNDMFTVGAGYLDIWGALNNTSTFNRNQFWADSPVAHYNGTTRRVELVPNSYLIWNQSTSPFRTSYNVEQFVGQRSAGGECGGGQQRGVGRFHQHASLQRAVGRQRVVG